MKAKKLLLLCVLFTNTLVFGTTYTVINTNESGDGSLAWAFTSATAADDVVSFNVDTTEFTIPAAISQSLTVEGLNQFNGAKIILKKAAGIKFADITGKVLTLKNIIFDGENLAGAIGITADVTSTLNIENCVLKNINSSGAANNGGACRIQGVVNITNSLFENNTQGSGGYGGGALCIYNAANITIDKCSFIGNQSNLTGNSGGGAIVARGTVATACNVTITNSTFANNISGKGGAILSSVQSATAFTANVKAINCTFTGNQGDGAISALTTNKGFANVYLVNSIVVNNVNAAANAYSDLLETKGTDAATVVLIEPHNVIYTTASATVVTTGRNCIEVADPSTATIFYELETFATDKKRPVLTDTMDQTVALLSSASPAKNAGVATLAGYTIPTVDQLNAARPATPAIGAVEYLLGTKTPEINSNGINLVVRGKELTVTGLTNDSEMSVYGLTGNLLRKSVVSNNQSVSLENISADFVIVKVQNQSYKLFLK